MYEVSKRYATWIGIITSAAAALIAAIGEMSGDELPLGVPPATLIQTSAALAIVVVVGRALQAFHGSLPVKWGLGSTLGAVAAGLSALLVVIGDIGPDAALLGASPEVMWKVSATVTAVLVITRQLQSAFGSPAPLPDANLRVLPGDDDAR